MAPPRERAVRALNRDAVLETGLADPAWLKDRREEAFFMLLFLPFALTAVCAIPTRVA